MQNKGGTIQFLAVIVIVGALLRREYVNIGQWITISAIIYYIVVNFVSAIKMAQTYKALTSKEKVRLFIFIIFVYIAIRGIVTMTASYFLILILLAVDYLLIDTQKTPKDE